MSKVVYLSPEEIRQSLNFVDLMREDKIKHSVIDKKFDAKNTSYAVNLMGHLGEQAASKVYGGVVDTVVRTGGDDGKDLLINGLRYQVKTSTTNSLIFNSADLFNSDYAILVTLVGDRTQPHIDSHFVVWGDISRERFMEVFQYKDYGYGKRLVCSCSLLTPPR